MTIPTQFTGIEITVLPETIGTTSGLEGSGGPFALLIATLWKTAVIVGALAVLLFLVWGALEWLTAGGEKDKLAKAKGRIADALVGLVILVASFAIISFVGNAIGFNILKEITWPTLDAVQGQ